MRQYQTINQPIAGTAKQAECYFVPCNTSQPKTTNLSGSFNEEHQQIVADLVNISLILSEPAIFNHRPDKPTSLLGVLAPTHSVPRKNITTEPT